jgi:hypothetical protein
LHSLRTNSANDILVAKGLYALEVMLIILGSCRLYAISHHLGPKLIAVYQMLANFLTFLAFYGLVLLAYGIAIQAILFPTTSLDGDSMSTLIYRPFFQLFGELMLGDLQSDSGCVGFFPFTTCGTMTVLVAPLVGLYLIVSNIMLVNLLIAMLSSTYARVEESSIELWRFQFYELVQEYHNRSVAPPPLSIVENVYIFARRLCRRLSLRFFPTKEAPQQQDLASAESDTLERFQERHTDAFLDSWRHAQTQTIAAQISKISTSFSHVGHLEGQLDAMQRRLDVLPTATASLVKQNSMAMSLKQAASIALSPVYQPNNLAALKRATTILAKPVDEASGSAHPQTLEPPSAGAVDPPVQLRHRPTFPQAQVDSLLNPMRRTRLQMSVGEEMWVHNSLARSPDYALYPVWERELKLQQADMASAASGPLAQSVSQTLTALSMSFQVQGCRVTVLYASKHDIAFTCYEHEIRGGWDSRELSKNAVNHEVSAVYEICSFDFAFVQFLHPIPSHLRSGTSYRRVRSLSADCLQTPSITPGTWLCPTTSRCTTCRHKCCCAQHAHAAVPITSANARLG